MCTIQKNDVYTHTQIVYTHTQIVDLKTGWFGEWYHVHAHLSNHHVVTMVTFLPRHDSIAQIVHPFLEGDIYALKFGLLFSIYKRSGLPNIIKYMWVISRKAGRFFVAFYIAHSINEVSWFVSVIHEFTQLACMTWCCTDSLYLVRTSKITNF